MSDQRKSKRSFVSTLVAILFIGVALAGLLVVRVYRFVFRRGIVSLGSLKFPVLVIQPDGMRPFAEWDSVRLERFPKGDVRTPVNGTVLIDSDFNMFTQERVERKREGDLKIIARYLLPDMRVKYTFDVRRVKGGGKDAAMTRLLQCPGFSENGSMRDAVARQTTLAGVLDVLELYKPIEAIPAAPAVAEAVDAVATQDSESGEPLP